MDTEKVLFDYELLDRQLPQVRNVEDTFSLGQLTTQISLFKYLAEAQTVQALISRVATLLRREGFSDFSHTLIGRREQTLDPIGTGNKQLNKTYYGEQYYLHDLMLHHAIRSDKPVLQTQIIDYIK